jgi:hypothetical protein
MTDTVAEWLLPVRRCTPYVEEVVVRAIPPSAEVLVQVGERVSADQPIARLAAGPGPQRQLLVVDVASALELPSRDLAEVLLRRRGDGVAAGEVLALRRARLPFLSQACRAPAAGRVVVVTHGWVVIETGDVPLDILALAPGEVTDVAVGSVAIRVSGAVVEAAAGSRGVAVGRLECPAAAEPSDPIPASARATILVIPGCVTRDLVQRASEVGVAGLVAGSLSVDLVAGAPLPVVATEGYGRLTMATDRLDLLRSLAGREAALVAAADDGWGGGLCAVFIPTDQRRAAAPQRFDDRPTQPGDRVCAVRAPFAGRVGRVSPPGSAVGQAHLAGMWPQVPVQFDAAADGQVEWVPWLNLERIG